MSSVSFKLETFEGPLDLLLHLIAKHKLKIQDIEISVLLEQYLAYLEDMEEHDFEYAGEFLAMAAHLIYIKTMSLLPKHEEAVEMKKELEGRLIEYSLCKKAASFLKNKCIYGEIFVRNPLELDVDKIYNNVHEPEELLNAYLNISAKERKNVPLQAKLFEPIVSKKIVSVTSKIIYVLRKLYTTGSCQTDTLFSSMTEKSEKIATFLAVLELTKSGRIKLNDDNSEIYFVRDRQKKQNS